MTRPVKIKTKSIGETLLSYRLAVSIRNRRRTHKAAAREIGITEETLRDNLYSRNFNPNVRTLVKIVKWLDGDISRIHDYIVDLAGHHIPALTKKGS